MSISQYQPRHRKSPGKSFSFIKTDNLYDRFWERYRLVFLRHNADCYSCDEKATVVDHLIPHKGDILLFKKLDNHIPLCKRCHDTITAKFDRIFKPGHPIGPKLSWINKMRSKKKELRPVKVLPSYEQF